jgi:hypothetical protein
VASLRASLRSSLPRQARITKLRPADTDPAGWRSLTPDAVAAAELIAPVGSDGVSPGATRDRVAPAVARIQAVASSSGEQPVAAAAAFEPVVAGTGLQEIPARPAQQTIIALAAAQPVVGSLTRESPLGCVRPPAATVAGESVVARKASDYIRATKAQMTLSPAVPKRTSSRAVGRRGLTATPHAPAPATTVGGLLGTRLPPELTFELGHRALERPGDISRPPVRAHRDTRGDISSGHLRRALGRQRAASSHVVLGDRIAVRVRHVTDLASGLTATPRVPTLAGTEAGLSGDSRPPSPTEYWDTVPLPVVTYTARIGTDGNAIGRSVSENRGRALGRQPPAGTDVVLGDRVVSTIDYVHRPPVRACRDPSGAKPVPAVAGLFGESLPPAPTSNCETNAPRSLATRRTMHTAVVSWITRDAGR